MATVLLVLGAGPNGYCFLPPPKPPCPTRNWALILFFVVASAILLVSLWGK